MDLRRFTPQIVEFCAEALKYAAREMDARRAASGQEPIFTTFRVPPKARRDDGQGCPYCAVGKTLAGAYRYCLRGVEAPSFRQEYVALTDMCLRDALDEAESFPNPIDRARVCRLIATIQHELSISLAPNLQEVAGRLWSISTLALDMAEHRGPPASPAG